MSANTYSPEPLCWERVLLEEHEALHGPLDPETRARILARRSGADLDAAALGALHAAAYGAGTSALCLSGGGIRSASFSVGVLQALARMGTLTRFDYLSTVSGGGFAGAWLTAWLRRSQDDPGAARELLQFSNGQRAAAQVEPQPLLRLRRFVRYMSPRAGLFSADDWTIGATMARNLLLNWLVLLPVLSAVLLLPRLHAAFIRLAEHQLEPGFHYTVRTPETWVAALAGLLLATSVAFTIRDLPSYGNARASQRQFLGRVLLPLCLGVLTLTYLWSMDRHDVTLPALLVTFGGGHALVWVVSELFSRRQAVRPRTWLAAALSGMIPSVNLLWLTHALYPPNEPLLAFYVATAFPLLLVNALIAQVVFIGFAGSDVDAADLEWWSRFAAWVLIAAAGWAIASAIVFGGPALFDIVRAGVGSVLNLSHSRASVVTNLLAPTFGAIGAWLARPARGAGARRFPIALWGPVFVVTLLMSIAWANDQALTSLARTPVLQRVTIGPLVCTPEQEAAGDTSACHPAGKGFVEVLALASLLLLLGAAAGALVPVNKFSLAGMYRQRLARTFLGASRDARQPNPFTGFDPEDDLAMSDLASVRPLHLANATLNMVADPQLGRQEVKADSFTVSPLHAGTARLGYRPSSHYASDPATGRGITLGTAITISGAAASPSMGMYSSPALTFLLTLLNARLGAWVGNPGAAGRCTWFLSDPPRGGGLLLDELLGRTTATRPHVYLSDGGHFDNLGLVEAVRRRCRYIVVVDAGADPEYGFADLANAVRRIRIDLGINIEMDALDISRGGAGAEVPHALAGRVFYEDVDGPGAVGTLVYLKPALSGDEPVDVHNYAAAHRAFPHEPTVNQWFTEAQFESYRVLGMHTAYIVAGAAADADSEGVSLSVPALCAAALSYRRQFAHGVTPPPQPAAAGV